jgi:hypothetical protein
MSALDDEPAAALAQAEIGADAWRAPVRHQLRAPADHTDYYAPAGTAVLTLHALDDLSGILGTQVAEYATGRRVYDDTGEIDPLERLRQARAEIDATRDALHRAEHAANGFWSAIGHIGIEAQP